MAHHVFDSTRVILSVVDSIQKPDMFIRPEKGLPFPSDETTPMPTLPIFDFQTLVSAIHQDTAVDKLFAACKDWGFFQVVNHGISLELLEKLQVEIEKFFKLPLEEKAKYQIRPGDVQGYGTVIRCKDQKLDWGNRFYAVTNPVEKRKPHLLPQFPSSLRDILESYLSEQKKLGMALLGLIGKGIGMDIKEVEDMFDDGLQSMRMSYYPPCPQPELVVGITPHSDATGITILHQANGVEGFQIKKNGVWMPITFLPNAFVVNVGDIMEILSNGIYTSVEHRALVNSEKERFSIAIFFNPKFEAEVGPVKSLISSENSPLYKTMSMEDHFKAFFSRNLDGKSYLEKVRIKSLDKSD